MHWLDGLYRLVYSTAMREITRSISYSEMERLGIERIIILECGVCDCTPIYTSRQNTQLSWLLSPAALPTGHWLRLPKLLMSGSSTSSKSSTLLLQQSSRQCCFLLWLNQTLTLLPTCAHWTLLLTSDKSLPWKGQVRGSLHFLPKRTIHKQLAILTKY